VDILHTHTRFAVPDKIFGLTLFLDFIDRCTALGSLHPPQAALPSLTQRAANCSTPRYWFGVSGAERLLIIAQRYGLVKGENRRFFPFYEFLYACFCVFYPLFIRFY